MKKKKTDRKKDKTTILLAVILIVGLSLLLYPTVSDFWNSFHQTRAVADYVHEVEKLDSDEYDRMLGEAIDYNTELAEQPFHLTLTKQELKKYNSILDVSGTGIMGYIEIPRIHKTLAIYHSTDDDVLQVAVGHVEGTSFPVGGPSTHCVLSGHRGLPTARLFTDITELAEGDIFMLRTLDEVLTYEVDSIRIVLPEEVDGLKIEKGKDLCTLVTCTPYGINTHRLLVRGHRVPTEIDPYALIVADAIEVDRRIVALFLSIPMVIGLIIYWIRRRR